MNRVDRLLGYLLMFQSRKIVRAQDLAAKFEVSERTVYRDIEALYEVGVPIVGVPGEGYQLMEGYYLPPIMFSEAEARSLFLSIALLTGLTKKGATQAAASAALEKIRAVLPVNTLAQVEALQAILGFYTVGKPPLDVDDEKFVRLQQAIQQRRLVHLRYHARHDNQVSERDVESTVLAYVDNSWLLGGYCRLRQEQRNFRLDRIDHLALLREHFTPRELAMQRLPEAGQRVVVRFDNEIVRWVREAQHFAFVADLESDERGAVMEYLASSPAQLLGWLLRWGEQMEVLEPPELRDQIAQAAARMAAQHAPRDAND